MKVMSMGDNRAILNKNFNEKYGSLNKKNKPCIFLSYRSLDKDMVRNIGDYIKKVGIDIYLDENDGNLQIATQSNDDQAITNCIKAGLSMSTHVLCLLSNKTVDSWWVPYEVGYGEMGKLEIASLKLKELTLQIPSYLRIRELMKNIEELNTYLSNIANNYGITTRTFSKYSGDMYKMYKEASIIEKSSYHPLSAYLY